MQLHLIAEASGYLGSILGVAMVVPQIARTYRNRTLPGVSAMSWALTALSCCTWMLYGVRTSELPQIPGNVLLVTGAVVLVLAVPSRFDIRSRAAALAGSAVVLLAAAFTLPAPAIGFVGFGIGMISGLPQIVVSLGRRTGDSAISLTTWALRVASQACWLFYALALDDLVVSISAAFLMSSAALVLVTELVRRDAVDAVPAPVLVTTP
jgi:uncharacterized protein with PQ loop repeat